MKRVALSGAACVLLGAAAMLLSAAPAGVPATAIAFERAGQRGISVIRPDGSGKKTLGITSRFRRVEWYEPTWSRTGGRLALLGAFDDGTTDRDNRIYVRAPNGRAKDLTWVDIGTHGIAWSRDGKRLVTDTGGDLPQLTLISLATGHTHLVSKAFYGYDPAWSPDGRWICFEYGVDGDGTPTWRGLALVHPNGRGLRRLGPPAGARPPGGPQREKNPLPPRRAGRQGPGNSPG